jgi:hypothetical protein
MCFLIKRPLELLLARADRAVKLDIASEERSDVCVIWGRLRWDREFKAQRCQVNDPAGEFTENELGVAGASELAGGLRTGSIGKRSI